MNKEIIQKLTDILNREKFIEDNVQLYPGFGDEAQRLIVAEKLNSSIKEIIRLYENDSSAQLIEKRIREDLTNFKEYCLDTENRERLTDYYEEIGGLLGVTNMNMILNQWLYGELHF